MARLIPNEPAGNVPPAVARLFRLVKQLPDSFTVWFALNRNPGEKPHFFIVWQERYGFLLQVAETSQQLAESALQRDFLTETQEVVLTAESLGREESEVLHRFARDVHASLDLPPETEIPVRRLVVFPNVQENTIEEIVLQRSPVTGVAYLGCHQLGEEKFAERLMAAAVEAMPALSLSVFRRHFSPESALPDGLSPLTPPERNTAATLTEMLIDFDQEAVAKADLRLPPEGEDLVRDLNARLVTGVAGSGKSLVLLIRALLMARLHENARLLVLTHNRPLNGELRRRFRRFTGHWPDFEWMTYFQWVRHCLPPEAWPDQILSGRALESLAEAIRARHPALSAWNMPFILDEVNWIKDQRFHARSTYLAASRQGRGVPLSAAARESMWAFFRDYQLALEQRGATDWSGVAMRFWKMAILDRQISLPSYDGIFVDEAQFFAPSWFDCVKSAVRPGGQLFLCADPTQGFLRRRQSWLASGIDVRGKTVRLSRSYRHSRPILELASHFYRTRLGREAVEEAVNLPSETELAEAPAEGPDPVVLRCGSPQDMLTRTVNEIVRLAEGDLRPGSILVMHRTYAGLETIHRRLKTALGERASEILQEVARPDAEALVGLTTLNAGTGLEAPIVFVLGTDELFEAEDDPRLSPEERAGLRRDHTRQIYMAMTRAARRLVLLCHRDATVAALTGRPPQ